MKEQRVICLIFLTACAAYLSCVNHTIAGGSSSTDNGKILGMIYRENGLPASHALVTLRSADFDPYLESKTVQTATTDSMGDYAFTSVLPGSYSIEAVNGNDGSRAFVDSVKVDSSIAYAPVAPLLKPGSLSIRFQNGSASTSSYIYIPGTSHFAWVRSGTAFIDSVPAGIISNVVFKDFNDPALNHVIKNDFMVYSNAIREIADYSAWKYSKRLFLNTTINGANISGNVINFPVLVRLSSVNFDFGQAKSDGSDLRFKKQDDSPLSYEIERWDPVGQNAEIWVRLDTIYGNDSTHFFTQYWGNPTVMAESNSVAVFDTTVGFVGVWHFSGSGTAPAYDATANGYSGIASNMTAASAIEGAIGLARAFNGSSSYITMPNTASSRLNFPENGVYSMSLWVYADTIDTLWHAIAGKSHEQYYMQFKCFGHNRASWEFVEFQNQHGWYYTEDSTPPQPGAKQWLYLVGVRSGKSQRLYVNGKLAVDSVALMPGAAYARNAGEDFSIGKYGESVTIPFYQGWSYFKGKIDEVRLSRGEPTEDWIRLCYMNQKTHDKLVLFK